MDTIEDSKSSAAHDSKERAIQQPAEIGSKAKAEEDKSGEPKSAGRKRLMSEMTQDPDNKDDAKPEPSCKVKKLEPNSQPGS